MENHFSRFFKLTLFLIALILSLSLTPTIAYVQGLSGQGGLKERLAQRGIDLSRLRERIGEVVQVQNRYKDILMETSGVVGTGTGITSDGEAVVKVFTARAGIRGIPTSLDGVRVRSEVSGRFYALRGLTCDSSADGICTNSERWPLPVPTGVSVGHPAITAGTIGARVTDGTDVFILSNNHILAAVNQANLGDPILQPGSFDGGVDSDDAVASLSAFEPISFCTSWFFWLICNQTNTIDAAIALSTPGESGFETPMGEFGSVVGYGAPSSSIHPAYGDPYFIGDEVLFHLIGLSVQKHGRTTGNTVGTVDAINATVDVCYDDFCGSIARFVDQIIITPGSFSAGGDSGSLIVTNDGQKNPVGLLFAGSDTQTIANRIDLVLTRFGVDIDGEGALPSLSIDDVTVTEGDEVPVTNAIFTVTLSASSSESVTAEFATSDGSATAGEDYVTNSGTVTFPAGITIRTITIEVNDDLSEEPNEDFYVNLSNPTNATIADDRGKGTILDDDTPPPTPQITIDDVSVDEGGSGTTGSADFTVSLSAATTNTVTVDYATYSGPGTSANPGEDYEAAIGTLTFSPGSTIETIRVTVYGDDIDESDENFFVNLSNPVNATMVDSQGEGTIVNDDSPLPSGPLLELVKVQAHTNQWTSVSLTKDYDDEMVVVCTPNYSISGLGPTVVRVRNAVDDRFEVGLARPWFGALPGDHWSTDVHCMVVRAGVYTEAEHGVKMEAVRLDNFASTDNFRSWAGESQSYLNTYTRPVVVGQVIGGSSSIPGEIGDWSVFWTRGGTVKQPPSSSTLYLGRHTGEDPSGRSMESIGYVVIEEGTGTIEGVDYAAALGPDTVRGVTNGPPYTYTVNGLSSASTAILSQAGMDGANGGWAILYGSNPVTASQIYMAIEEDWYRDSERNHTTEQVGYIVFE